MIKKKIPSIISKLSKRSLNKHIYYFYDNVFVFVISPYDSEKKKKKKKKKKKRADLLS